MKLLNLCQEAVRINEIGNDPFLAYRFSDPDGLRTGKSGYSYGASQFDIENNWSAIKTLEKCGMSPKDLKRLFLQDREISDLNAKLVAHSDVVDEADLTHINNSVNHIIKYCGDNMDRETLVHLVDYHNQFDFTPFGKMHQFLVTLGRQPRPQDILVFKLNETKWGRENPSDVHRRYDNIRDILSGRGSVPR